mmetsp:Transcript_3371/g.7266  ORF Transcript_3371/g.7266 Transcript_3371/m.7266 type:complete len:209 (-) Transcript_3371:281-907(-)
MPLPARGRTSRWSAHPRTRRRVGTEQTSAFRRPKASLLTSARKVGRSRLSCWLWPRERLRRSGPRKPMRYCFCSCRASKWAKPWPSSSRGQRAPAVDYPSPSQRWVSSASALSSIQASRLCRPTRRSGGGTWWQISRRACWLGISGTTPWASPPPFPLASVSPTRSSSSMPSMWPATMAGMPQYPSTSLTMAVVMAPQCLSSMWPSTA